MHSTDLRLKCPFTMLISGPSNCGKTTFCRQLLRNRKYLYNVKPNRVYWFYKAYQASYDEMLQEGDVDECVEGLPTMNWIADNINSPNCTIVIDDMALEVNDDTAKIFSVASHHYNLNVLFITQNLFTSSPSFRYISLNTTYNVIFKNPRDKSSITNFAKQFAPGKTKALTGIYNYATRNPHSYLFIDYHQETSEDNRILSNILSENDLPIHIYQIKA